MSVQSGTFSALRHAMFRSLWAASIVSNTGGMIQIVGAAWLMTLLTPSQSMVALVQASVTLPLMIFSLLAGVLADNYDRRRVMLTAQAFMLVVSLILTVVAFFGLLSPLLLLTLTFLIGAGMALHNPSWQASFSDLVPRDDLPAAATLNAMGMNITRSIGPALGGVVVAMFGAPMAFAFNAFTYLPYIVALSAWQPLKPEQKLPREPFFRALSVGVRYFLLSPNIKRASFRGFVFAVAAIAMQALLPLVARDVLGGDASVYGLLLAAFGLGAVIGALGAAQIRSRFSTEHICRVAPAILAAACVITAFSGNFFVSVVTICIAGANWINVMSLLNVTVQMSSPRWVIGRMIALFMTLIFGGMAIGSWIWGLLAEAAGLQIAFLGAAAVLVIGILVGLRYPVAQYGGANVSPMEHVNEPKIQLNLVNRSGPIVIMVQYRIAQDHVSEFLEAMVKRRHIRLRDGARHWALLRDLQDPDSWIESYHLATWADYLRHNERRTLADLDVIERLAALHQGPGQPVVHRMIERQDVTANDDTPRIIAPPDNPH